MVRQAEAKQRQAISRINQDLRRQHEKVKSVVRTHNNEVRRNRQKLEQALRKIGQTPIVVRYQVLYRSTVMLDQSYTELQQSARFDETDPRYRLAVALPERENANNLAVTRALVADGATEFHDGDDDDVDDEQALQDTRIGNELKRIEFDLHSRWLGAVFALNPGNPDATRHFCSSAREIFTQILHLRAPDAAVIDALPHAECDQRGAPTRRSRIQFMLHRKGLQLAALEDFVDKNIDNVIDLFDVLNKGTHGAAGHFDISTLRAVKRRVEDAILFVTDIAS